MKPNAGCKRKEIVLTKGFGIVLFLESFGDSNLTGLYCFRSADGLEGALRGDHTTGVLEPESLLVSRCSFAGESPASDELLDSLRV